MHGEHGEHGDRAYGASSMGSSLGRRCRASWGARPWHPGLTSGTAGSRLRRAHAGGWVGAQSVESVKSVDPLLDLKSWDGSSPICVICVICVICGSASALDWLGLSLADNRVFFSF